MTIERDGRGRDPRRADERTPGDDRALEPRRPVQVKGYAEPVALFNLQDPLGLPSAA